MITEILNVMNTMFQTPQVSKVQAQPKAAIENPFASPFIKIPSANMSFDGRNQPIAGGYFAGYHNNKKNIVGKRLFIAV